VPSPNKEAIMRKRISIVVSVIALLSVLSGSALAADGPAYAGACNMLHDSKMIDTMVAHLLGKPGWDGMFHAAAVSGGGDCS
jgi:hypothetical protein